MTAKNESEYCSVSDDCLRLLSIHCTTVCQDLRVTLDTVQVTNQRHEVKINMLWVNGLVPCNLTSPSCSVAFDSSTACKQNRLIKRMSHTSRHRQMQKWKARNGQFTEMWISHINKLFQKIFMPFSWKPWKRRITWKADGSSYEVKLRSLSVKSLLWCSVWALCDVHNWHFEQQLCFLIYHSLAFNSIYSFLLILIWWQKK